MSIPSTIRHKNAIKALHTHSIDGLLILDAANIYYLTGIFPQEHQSHREVMVLLTDEKIHIYHSPLLSISNNSLLSPTPFTKNLSLTKWLKSKSKNIGADLNTLYASEYQKLRAANINISHIDQALANLRSTKDTTEQKYLIKAGQITQAVAAEFVDNLKKPNPQAITELTAASLLKELCYKHGAHDIAFAPIVAFDEHSAIPHHAPTEKKLTQQSVVLFDFGVRVNHYCSDFTRTIKLGAQTDQFLHIQELVLEAYKHGLDLISTNNYFKDVHKKVVQYFRSKNVDQYFTHSIGHGIGLDVHESPHHSTTQPLSNNQAITIEPGLYLDGKYGYRHENTILIKNGKPISLTD